MEKSGIIQIEDVLESRETKECLSVLNVDGSMRKTAKSKLLESVNRDPIADSELPRHHVSIVDMGLIWRLATPTHEDRETRKRDGEGYAWGDYLDKICTSVCSRHSNAKLIIMVNDD